MRTFRLGARPAPPALDLDGQLNPGQRAVALAGDGPILVVAGAGTGKTRAVTWRVARLLADGADPDRVMLVTFTNRAAREMVHRVQQLAGADGGRIWAGTFHHVAHRLVRDHAERLGWSEDFTVIDGEDARDVMAVARSETVAGGGARFPQPAALVTMHALAASTGGSLEQVLEERYPMFAHHAAAIAAVHERYRAEKRRHQMLDFDDLLSNALRLLDEHDADGALAARFQHVLVDEYQDTSAVQAALVDRLAAAHGNVCVVGDDAQSIYRFRGACSESFTAFLERYPGARTLRLETNYRSTPQILALANASIARNPHQQRKHLVATRGDGVRPAVVPCADHLTQARFIAEYILALLDEGRELWDIAVLYRSHWHALEIQLELQRYDVPYEVRGGLRFFEQAHIKDALAFLRLVHNPRDALAWQRVLRMAPRVGEAVARRIWRRLDAADDPVAALGGPIVIGMLGPGAKQGVAEIAELLVELRAAPLGAGPAGVLERLLERYYDDRLAGRYENADRRRQDLHGVIDFARQYATLASFLADVAMTGDFSGETCEDGPDEQHFVTLSTVHQAKGLEWKVVLMPWMSDGRFPTDLAMGSPADLEEERRLFHVAVTRARDELYLVVPQVWSTHRGVRTVMKPSRFLTELDGADVLETMRLEGELPRLTVGGAPEHAR